MASDGDKAPAAIELPLDHAVVLVEDLAAAAEGFETLGFTVLPESRHSAEMGTANRCIILGRTYLELLGVVAPTERNARWRALMAGGPGLYGLALRSRTLKAERAALEAAGLPIGPTLSFSRAEATGELRFSVARLEAAATPGLQLFFCCHHTPELLWQADRQRHVNGARELSGVTLAVAEPEPLAATLAAVAAALPETGGRAAVTLGPAGAPGVLGFMVTGAGGAPRRADLSASAGIVVELLPA